MKLIKMFQELFQKKKYLKKIQKTQKNYIIF